MVTEITFSGKSKGAIDTNVDSNTFKTVELGTFQDITIESQLYLVSDNANDSSSGTGARKIKLSYLDSSFNEYVEIITLNGTTQVQTVATNILHIEDMGVIETGSLPNNQGRISIRNVSGTETYATIEPGQNEYFTCVHHIPAGKVAYVTNIYVGSLSTGQIEIRMMYEKDFSPEGGGTVEKIFETFIVSNSDSKDEHFPAALRVTGGHHIRLVAKSSMDGQALKARFFYFEVDE